MFYDKKIPINSNNNTFYRSELNSIKEDSDIESIFESQENNVESLDETTFDSYMEFFSSYYNEENIKNQTTSNNGQNNEIIDENEILVQQLEAEIAKLESQYNASQEGKGIAGGIGDLFSSCWNGITGKGFKNGDRVELDKKIELLKAAKSNPAKLAEAYKNIMGVELTDEVKQSAIEAQNVANSLSTEEKEAVADLLKEQAASLSELMEQSKDDQGWFSKTMGAINNVLGFGTNSIKADVQIEEYIKQVNSLDPNDPDFATKYQAITGEALSFDGINELAQGVSKVGNSPAAEAIMDYEETQVAAKEIGSGIVTGVVTAICVIAAPFTGGASLLLGAAVGGATTVLINGTDTIGTSKKYSFEQGVLDFAGGAINGAVTAMTLGGAGLAGKGLSVLKGAGSTTAKQTAKEMISGGFKNTVKTAFNGFGKAAWNGAKIAGMSSTANYLLNTVGTNALYDATGNYTKSESPANIVQNEDGTYSIYYALTDSNTGDLISYEIETLDSLSQDEEGNLIKGNILDVSRSNDFDFGDFAEQTIVSMGSAALGAGIGKITGNIINPYATSMTNSVILGNTAEIATDMTLSLGADYLIECARRGEIVDKDEFFSWDRILGEGQNQIRGLLIGIASTKANAIATDSVRAGLDGKSGTGTEIRLDGTSAPKTQQEVLESAGRLIIEENNPTKAVELLSTFGMSKTQIDAFVSEARSVMQETSSTCAVASVLNGVNNKNLLLERLSQKIQYDGTNDTYRINIGGEEVSVKLNQWDNPLQKVYEAYVEKYGDNPTTAIKVFDALFDDASDIIVKPDTGNIEQLREYIQDEKTILTFNTADGVAGLVKDHAYTVLEIDDAGNIRLQDPATLREFVISKEQYEGKDCQIEGKTYRDDGLVQDGVEAKMVAGAKQTSKSSKKANTESVKITRDDGSEIEIPKTAFDALSRSASENNYDLNQLLGVYDKLRTSRFNAYAESIALDIASGNFEFDTQKFVVQNIPASIKTVNGTEVKISVQGDRKGYILEYTKGDVKYEIRGTYKQKVFETKTVKEVSGNTTTETVYKDGSKKEVVSKTVTEVSGNTTTKTVYKNGNSTFDTKEVKTQNSNTELNIRKFKNGDDRTCLIDTTETTLETYEDTNLRKRTEIVERRYDSETGNIITAKGIVIYQKGQNQEVLDMQTVTVYDDNGIPAEKEHIEYNTNPPRKEVTPEGGVKVTYYQDENEEWKPVSKNEIHTFKEIIVPDSSANHVLYGDIESGKLVINHKGLSGLHSAERMLDLWLITDQGAWGDKRPDGVEKLYYHKKDDGTPDFERGTVSADASGVTPVLKIQGTDGTEVYLTLPSDLNKTNPSEMYQEILRRYEQGEPIVFRQYMNKGNDIGIKYVESKTVVRNNILEGAIEQLNITDAQYFIQTINGELNGAVFKYNDITFFAPLKLNKEGKYEIRSVFPLAEGGGSYLPGEGYDISRGIPSYPKLYFQTNDGKPDFEQGVVPKDTEGAVPILKIEDPDGNIIYYVTENNKYYDTEGNEVQINQITNIN